VRLMTAVLFVAFLTAQFGMAQSATQQKNTPPEQPATSSESADSSGPTAFVQAEGGWFNMGAIATYDFDLGYRVNSHTSVDIGVPLMTTRTFFPITAADYRYQTILGTPYVDVRYDTKYNKTNVTSILTGAIGINMVKTYSDGRMTVDWFNHFDRSYQVFNYDALFSPFLNLEAGTGTVDRQVMPRPFELNRPYETLGLIGSGEVGGKFTFRKSYHLEGSAYGLSPVGPQKVYSRIVAPDYLLGGDGHHNRFWDQYFETGGEYVNTYGSGPSRISRDNGWGAYLTIDHFERFDRLHRAKNFDIMLGYTRSVHYGYDTAFIMLRYNLTGLLRGLTIGE
jgi:hypothetical protein